ncbi:hypothetical protein [Xanthomonas sp. XNM01]|uniref:hypothetical protein n=1 Tax=Xanthomonas sp. XNM01 TaxID=2769289 RepID=UPI001782B5E2|nr:hypothetical protein [Xanthomonas sp. XNM01]MBD9368557.1 hypothetical protein [Xanthomonas sp. XNM01]
MQRRSRHDPFPRLPAPRTEDARLATRLRLGSLSAGGAAPAFARRARVAGLPCVSIAMHAHDLTETNRG